MTRKLTLTLDNKTIERAKKYARENKISLSKLVEFYFRSLGFETRDDDVEIAPITKELIGIAKFETSKTDRELLEEALSEKFL